MKDNSLDGHRGKVALSDTARNANIGSIKCELKSPSASGDANTNFDDDYNEWELGIGDLIIDLDADIEKTNGHNHHQNGADSFSFLSGDNGLPMSNSKSPRLAGGGTAVCGGGNGSSNGASGSGTFEHQATVDKGLKMKIKRKTVGSKYSEAKHEIVQSDTKASGPVAEGPSSASSSSAANSPAGISDTPKSKHSSSKGRNSSHREKKEKNRDKEKNLNVRNVTATSTPEVNGVLGVMSPLKITNSGVSISSPAPPSLCSNSSPLPSSTPASSPARCGISITNSPASNGSDSGQQPVSVNLSSQSASSPPMPNLTLKLENKFPCSTPCPVPSVVIKAEDGPDSPPQKKIKLENIDPIEEDDGSDSSIPPEMRDNSTSTSVGTVVEPDCLGPCEPGTSVMLEGIVWQETEGGVLVVNVTWRGKTYVGTLLDCTKHDWAPPRFCESPTSDVDSKTNKGRGKRGGRNNTSSNANEVNTFTDTRNCVQSKLRNGKGRRTTINSNAANSGFTVPNSPAKGECASSNNNKRKSRPDAEPNQITTQNEINSKSSKRNRTQSKSTPTSTTTAAELLQPSSPQLIECPEPNCNKRYKHINGLKYHQTHAHSSESGKLDDTTTEDSKDVTNSSDNEESMQESTSVSTSPGPTFANTVPSGGKPIIGCENVSSSSSSVSGLPETDPYSLTTDLSTLASVAICDSKVGQRTGSVCVSQDTTNDNDNAVPVPVLPIPNSLSNSASPSPALSTMSDGLALSIPVSAVTTSVIQSSSSMENSSIPQSLNENIPQSHAIFSQGHLGTNNVTTCTYTSTVSNSLSPSRSGLSSSVTTALSTMSSTTVSSPPSLPLLDKSKIKQEKSDRYKSKSPVPSQSIRPIVPAPPSPQLLPLSSNVPGSHQGLTIAGHCVSSSLKPIQPKPTILGEPTTINPSLESLKKDKIKHKKKSKDKDREKKVSTLPITPTKLGMNPGEECEALELTSYPSLDIVSGPLSSSTHTAISPLLPQTKPPDTSLDMSLPDDTINENIQSPAYSDISDANDTAPVLESEVPSGKDKEDKIGKTTPDASQSPVANISAYGIYPYYSQPPYLLPSVSPQSAVTGSQGPNMLEKTELSKKNEQERVKENRPWSNSSGERERQHLDHESDKKQTREEGSLNSTTVASPAATGVPVQDYPIPQHYPYPYGYVQGYSYPVDSSAYHMHMIESDPHYKQQYKQYLDDHHRMYKEQHHHQHQQQAHHAQHQSSHHQSKSHHSSLKEDRDRSREGKDRNSEKISSSGIIAEHSSKMQHSSMTATTKDSDVRELDTRPPSLPAQSSSSSAAALKEKQNENHQILKENIELKTQMEENKNKINQYEMAMIYERHREDMRRFYMLQDRVIEQQQQKMEPGLHHHTHHHQTIQPHGHLTGSSYTSSSLKSHKEDGSSHSGKTNHYGERSSVVSPAKSEHIKSVHSTASPKGGVREPSKEYLNSGKKDVCKSSDNSTREDKKADKSKSESKVESEGQKPTMETTGPPPPPTNSYAYLHPSYLQPPPPHFPHMPFEPAHAMYRGGINPMIVSAPHYGNSPYVHPQIRYVTPDLPPHAQPPDPLVAKLHPSGPPKALDLLHQVSQHYTSTHKIHELQEHALMSPTSTPSTAPSTGGKGATEPAVAVSKIESSRDTSRSPPTQRHLHTHHHTHVGVGYPIYDPYGVAAQKTYT